MKIQIPLAKVLAIVGKVIRYARGGISKDEAADLVQDLLALAADIAENADSAADTS